MHLLRSLALALTVTASLAACGGGSKPAPAEPAPAAEAAPQNEAPSEAPIAEAPAADPEAPAGGSSVWTGSTGAPACDEYLRLIETYIACDKIPAETREATRQAIDMTLQSWGDIRQLPPDAQQQVHEACVQASDVLRQGAVALGCTL